MRRFIRRVGNCRGVGTPEQTGLLALGSGARSDLLVVHRKCGKLAYLRIEGDRAIPAGRWTVRSAARR